MNWVIDDSHLPKYIFASLEGKPTLEDYRAFWDELILSENWRPGTPVIKDIRRRNAFDGDGYEIVSHIADYLNSHTGELGHLSLAIVADQEEGYRYSRVLEYAVRLRNADILIRTFSSESAAIEWVDKARA